MAGSAYPAARPGRLRLVTLVAAAVVLAAALAGTVAAHVRAGGSAGASRLAPNRQALLVGQDAGIVQSWAVGLGATGIYWDPSASTYVARVPDARLAAAQASLAAVRATQWAGGRMPLQVRLRPAVTTASDVNAGLALLSRQDWVPGVKKYTWGFFYDIQRDVTVVQTDAPAAITTPLHRLIKNPIILQHSTYHQDATRNNDSIPFYGGAAIVDTTTNELCTAGFAFTNQLGDVEMLTAGHCGNPDDRFRVRGTSAPGTTTFGWGFEKAPYPTYDSMTISCITNCATAAAYAGRLWTSGTTSEPVRGSTSPVAGQNDWFTSGTLSNYHGGRTIQSTSATLCTDGDCTPGLMSFRGTTLCQSGDSGAPVFRELAGSGQGAWVGGTYVGINGQTMYAEKWNSLQGVYAGSPQLILG